MSESNKPWHLTHAEQKALKKKVAAYKSRYLELIERSFCNPVSAMRRMDKIAELHGAPILHKRLASALYCNFFGRLPGSLLSWRGYQPGAKAMRLNAMAARRQLANAYQKYYECRDLYLKVSPIKRPDTYFSEDKIKRRPVWELKRQRSGTRKPSSPDSST